MPNRLHNKKILITGATGGLGRALVDAFSFYKTNLILIGRDGDSLRKLKQKIESNDVSVVIYVADLSDGSSLDRLIEILNIKHPDIDILISNAGVGAMRDIASSPVETFYNCIEVNLMASIKFTKALLPRMLDRNEGSLVFISSGVAGRAIPYSAPYNLSKAALTSFVDTLRTELLLTKLQVLTVYPGAMDTNFDIKALGSNSAVKINRSSFFLATPRKVALKIINAIINNDSECEVFGPAWVARRLNILMPRFLDKIIFKKFKSLNERAR